jgi:hypothetical protein
VERRPCLNEDGAAVERDVVLPHSAVCIVKPQVKCLVCAGFGVLGLVVGG